MGVKLNKVPQLNTEELSDSEALLLQLVRERDECIQELKDEIARLKGEKEKPQIKPSRLEPKSKANQQQESEQQTSAQENSDSPEKEKKKRAGSAKRKKTLELTIHENKVIKPIEEIEPGSEFKGYQDYTVQELLIKPHNIRYRLARWKTPTGEYLRDYDEWHEHLKLLGFVKPRHIKTATEGALLGALIESGLKPNLGIISDGAGQFRLLEHALCWVHAERLINRLIPITEVQRQAVETVQDQLWDFYQELKTYKTHNSQQQQLSKPVLEERFEQIFTQTTLFETLNQVLKRLYRRKTELLKVLDRPDSPKIVLYVWPKFSRRVTPGFLRIYGDVGDERFNGERKLYRYSNYGSDAAFFVLDTRSFRDDALDGPENFLDTGDRLEVLEQSLTEDRTLLGNVQLSDLKQDLLNAENNDITWKFVMVPEPIQNIFPGINTDAFEGYGKERTEILKFINEVLMRNIQQ